MKSGRSLFIALICLALCAWGAASHAQNSNTILDASERQLVVERVSELVIENYVFPDIARQTAEHIEARLESGAYNDIGEHAAFAKQLTDDVQSINSDKHMRIRVREPERAAEAREDPDAARARQLREARERNFGFMKAERLEGNVGYLDMRGFPPVDLAGETGVSAMKFLNNADALIFDMRQNGGGSPGMVQLICSYLFSEKTHLNSLYWRRGDRTDEFWTLDEIDGKRIPDVPVFVLTSQRTFSAAEEFTYNLQTRKRATIVGETTGGGANPGGGFPINEHFTIFIPTGRAINPVTGTNWEGVGVKPDIETDPDQALEVAHEKARQAAEEHRQAKIAEETKFREQRKQDLAAANEMFLQNRDEEAVQLVNTTLAAALSRGDLSEGLINQMGYQYLQENARLAVAIFKFNANNFPDSPNVYDSLGDGYDANDQPAMALESYRKAYQIGMETGDHNVEVFKKNVERLEEKLNQEQN